MAYDTHKKFLTTKISQYTVLPLLHAFGISVIYNIVSRSRFSVITYVTAYPACGAGGILVLCLKIGFGVGAVLHIELYYLYSIIWTVDTKVYIAWSSDLPMQDKMGGNFILYG